MMCIQAMAKNQLVFMNRKIIHIIKKIKDLEYTEKEFDE